MSDIVCVWIFSLAFPPHVLQMYFSGACAPNVLFKCICSNVKMYFHIQYATNVYCLCNWLDSLCEENVEGWNIFNFHHQQLFHLLAASKLLKQCFKILKLLCHQHHPHQDYFCCKNSKRLSSVNIIFAPQLSWLFRAREFWHFHFSPSTIFTFA